MPWLTIFRGPTGLTDIEKVMHQFHKIVKNKMAEIEAEELDFGRQPINYVEAFLKEIQRAENDAKSQFHKESGCKLFCSKSIKKSNKSFDLIW